MVRNWNTPGVEDLKDFFILFLELLIFYSKVVQIVALLKRDSLLKVKISHLKNALITLEKRYNCPK
jgi:hypothetical protein